MGAAIGIVGLGVMGRGLADNIAGRGFSVAVHDRNPEALAAAGAVLACSSLSDLVAALERPRRVLLMVNAGRPVDDVLDLLSPLLAAGDVVADAGNSHFADTERRAQGMGNGGILFVGAGISGGEAGARLGPAIMVGGAEDAWKALAPILTAIAARVDGAPCCARVGPGGAGHFVKMVHNGIEYAAMQLIAEAGQLLRDLGGLSHAALGEVFAAWNRGELESYLVGITSGILATTDRDTGRPLVEMILDTAGQKGTGMWSGVAALELGVAAPTLVEAVCARALSARKAERVAASRVLSGPAAMPVDDVPALIDDVGEALLASLICAYAQGFALIEAGSKAHDWGIDLPAVAGLWRGGCIIRARLLDRLGGAAGAAITSPEVAGRLAAAQDSWRRTAGLAVAHGIPAPALLSALAWYDLSRSGRTWASLIQAQRDCFGAHTYERIDRPGRFHTRWPEAGA